jgi:HlyD family secretion protein
MKIALIIVVSVVVLLGGGALIALPFVKNKLPGMGGAAIGTAVRMEPAATDSLTETIPAPGRIEPNTKVDISATIVAEIIALPFREGEEVKRGDVVVRLDDRDLLARLDAANASLEASQASLTATKASRDRTESQMQEMLERHKGFITNLEFAQRNLERKQMLYDAGDLALSELELASERVEDMRTQIAASNTVISGAESALASAEAQILQSEAAVKQAEAEIKLAEEGLRNTVIESPIDGRVTALNAEVGERVVTGTMNNPGTVIMTIADLSRMKMIAEVAESDVAKVSEGQTATIRMIAFGDEVVFGGVVDRVALQRTISQDGTGYFETEILLDLGGREDVKSGLLANADIEVATHEGLLVPSQSVVDRLVDDLPQEVVENPLVDRSKRAIKVVYRVENGKAIAVPVRTGASDFTHTVVREGLTEGDILVTGPYKVLLTIKHNDPVRDVERDEAARKAAAAAAPVADEAEGDLP